MVEYIPKHKNMVWRNIHPNTKKGNGGIYPQTLKHGMAEYTPKHYNTAEYTPKH